jgi:DNA-binding NarL/FixJ family response regulator
VAIDVVLAEDSYVVREGVQRLLERDRDIAVVAICADAEATMQAIERTVPDVVVTDIRMPPHHRDEGIELAARLRLERPEIGVVVLSQYDDPEYAVRLLDQGAAGRAYLLKERLSEAGQLTSAIKQVAAGGSVIDPRVVEVLVAARSRQERSPLDDLTRREGEVLALIAQGLSNEAIAGRLHLSLRVVEKHVGTIFSKLGLSEEREVHRRVKAVLIYLAHAA